MLKRLTRLIFLGSSSQSENCYGYYEEGSEMERASGRATDGDGFMAKLCPSHMMLFYMLFTVVYATW